MTSNLTLLVCIIAAYAFASGVNDNKDNTFREILISSRADRGTCGDKVEWVFDSKVLTIKGTGDMENYDRDRSAPWASHQPNIVKVVVEEGVTSIGDYAFYDYGSLKNASLPNGLKTLGHYAFYFCRGLTTVNIPDSVTSIGNYCFVYCDRITSLTVPNGVKTIGDFSFMYCDSLHTLRLPNDITSIGSSAFADCWSLKDFTIPSTVESIGDNAFYACHELSTFTIPAATKSIGKGAFNYCHGLSSIEVADGNTRFSSENGILFDYNHKTLLQYPLKNENTSFIIPDGVETVGYGAFYGSSFLVNITLPESIKIIEDSAFAECMKLANVNIPDGVTSIGDSSFSYSNLTVVSIPDSVLSLGKSSFHDSKLLTTVFYQGSIDFSSADAFKTCVLLNTVCVSPDYGPSEFCGEPVSLSSPTCQEFRNGFNHCFKASYSDGGIIQEKRRNATQFESRTNKCVEYQCNNEAGPLSWSLCNSSDEVTVMCMDDECVEKKGKSEDKKWSVEMDLSKIKQSEVNTTELIEDICGLTGIDKEDLVVGIEVDESGNIICVVMYVKDETTAKRIAASIEGLSEGASCKYDTLCRAKKVRVVAPEYTEISSGPHLLTNICLIIMATLMMTMV